jgi:predicted nucleic acid-binding protein
LKIIVADSCSLILLAKCNLLGILSEAFPVMIAHAVFNEVVNNDTIKLFPDAKNISDLIKDKKINVIKLKVSGRSLPIYMDKGETETLLLAKQTPDAIVATDDGKAIKACRYLNLSFIISPHIALELYRLNKINFERARYAVEKMKILGRYSSDIIADVILELEVIRNAKTSHRESS